MNVSVYQAEKLSLEEIRRFIAASQDLRFEGKGREQVYAWVEQVLCRQQYMQQGKAGRGLLRRYIEKMTGLSRAQVTRLIAQYTASGRVRTTVYRRHRFPQRYTRADIELLAQVDEAHETLSGPATRRILEREYRVYGKREYARLASISVAHLYNLRHSRRYRERVLSHSKTTPTAVQIGERRRPDPQGQPGYLRLDTVHQGDRPEEKGVYHINAVDEVTQWQIVAATERISEAYLLPVLEDLMRQFPFRILGFHTDNVLTQEGTAERKKRFLSIPYGMEMNVTQVASTRKGGAIDHSDTRSEAARSRLYLKRNLHQVEGRNIICEVLAASTALQKRLFHLAPLLHGSSGTRYRT